MDDRDLLDPGIEGEETRTIRVRPVKVTRWEKGRHPGNLHSICRAGHSSGCVPACGPMGSSAGRALEVAQTETSLVDGAKSDDLDVMDKLERRHVAILATAMAARIVLVLVSSMVDAGVGNATPKYTDVDYYVYSEAASLVGKGRSPFLRDTYRYSPLLAMLLVPNGWLHSSWGKWLFVAGDGIVATLIYWIVKERSTKPTRLSPPMCAALWLYNPFTASISTRGSCESITCAMVIGMIWMLMRGKVFPAALLYGLVVHLRIYPIIYALAILLAMDEDFPGVNTPPPKDDARETPGDFRGRQLVVQFLNRQRVIFSVTSATTFLLLTGTFYIKYGWPYLTNGLLYHLTRTDHRHNFSSYFYPIYLGMADSAQGSLASIILRWVAFMPQLTVQITLSLMYAKDLPFCMFISTFAFVAFNKVCTAQYFVWFFCLMPLVARQWTLGWRKALGIFAVWTAAQLNWLWWAYNLEFLGRNMYFQVWLGSLFFLAANAWAIAQCIQGHAFHPLFHRGRVVSLA